MSTTAAARFRAVPKEDLTHFGTDPVPATSYYDPTTYEHERAAIFRRVWLMVGRESELGEPDSFIVRHVTAANASILLTRGGDGTVRAFHNVCTHRGSQLVWEDSGTARSFSCHYHMWNFANDGSLRKVPDEGSFYDLNKANCGLHPIAVATCAGFIFVNLDTSPTQGLREFLGALGDELEAAGFARFTDFAQYSCTVNANWKTTFNNFQENYHVRWVHAPSAGALATSAENPFAYPTAYRMFGPHSASTLSHSNPRHADALTDVQRQALGAATLDDDAPCTGCRDNYFLFPNVFISPLGGTNPFTMQYWPLAVDQTRIVVRVYRTGPDAGASMRFAREYGAAFLVDVHAEDVDVVEATQRGLRSGALDHVHFQAQEVLCRHFQTTVAELVDAYRADSTPSPGSSPR